MKIRNISVTLAAASVLALPASAAAIGPVDQEMEHGAAPTTADGGFGTSPGAEPEEGAVTSPTIEPGGSPEVLTEPSEPAEAVAASISESEPGLTEITPEADTPKATQKTEGNATGATQEQCEQAAADIDGAAREVARGILNGEFAYAAEMFGFGMTTQTDAEKRGCVFTNSEEGETAE